MAEPNQIQNGYLVFADISGYTAYLTEAEQQHAGPILAALLTCVVENFPAPMVVANLEGVATLVPYGESFEHFGRVDAQVHDLRQAWERNWQQREATVVEPEGAAGNWQVRVPLSMPQAWDYITLPKLKKDWMQMLDVTREDDLGGRFGVGTAIHCARKTADFRYRFIDWRPLLDLVLDAGRGRHDRRLRHGPTVLAQGRRTKGYERGNRKPSQHHVGRHAGDLREFTPDGRDQGRGLERFPIGCLGRLMT